MLHRLVEGILSCKLDQINADPKGTGLDFRERRFVSKFYMDQSVKVKVDQGERRSMKTGKRVGDGCCFSPYLFNLYSEYLTKESLEGFGDFKIRGQLIRTVKLADELVPLAK